jgi:hypothetical protein
MKVQYYIFMMFFDTQNEIQKPSLFGKFRLQGGLHSRLNTSAYWNKAAKRPCSLVFGAFMLSEVLPSTKRGKHVCPLVAQQAQA